MAEIEDDLDKECAALGGLFQQIISEMKVRHDGCSNYIRKIKQLLRLKILLLITREIRGVKFDTEVKFHRYFCVSSVDSHVPAGQYKSCCICALRYLQINHLCSFVMGN